MKSQQTTQTPQGLHTPTLSAIHLAALQMTFQEIIELLRNLNGLLTALQNELEDGHVDLPTIEIED